jgi:hypothetical protein
MTQQLAALGYPASCDKFYACDTDAAAAQALPYFRVVANKTTGAYGDQRVGDAVCAKVKGAPYWETEAWDGRTVSKNAKLYQRVGKTRPKIAGVSHTDYDENVVLGRLVAFSSSGPVVITAATDVHVPKKPAKPKPVKRVPHPVTVKAKAAQKLITSIVKTKAKAIAGGVSAAVVAYVAGALKAGHPLTLTGLEAAVAGAIIAFFAVHKTANTS